MNVVASSTDGASFHGIPSSIVNGGTGKHGLTPVFSRAGLIFADLLATLRRSGAREFRGYGESVAFPRSGILGLILLVLCALAAPAFAQPHRHLQGFTPAPLDSGFGPIDTSQPVGITPAQVIARFAAKESRFKIALEDYTYRRTVKFDTLDDDGNMDGQYLEVDDIVFTNTGRKYEKVVYAPENTLTRVAMSPADFDDIEHRLPFSLTKEDIGRYRVTYVGKEAVDQLPMYVFDVTPKQMEKGRRYFTGRIWVDAHDFQIVVTNGKNIPDNTRPGREDLSVPFTTYRQQIDGKYWFPVYTRAEGVLHFENCKQCLPEDDHVREIVKYGGYKRFGSDVHIIYDGLAEKSQLGPLDGSPRPQSGSSAARAAPASPTPAPHAVPPGATKD